MEMCFDYQLVIGYVMPSEKEAIMPRGRKYLVTHVETSQSIPVYGSSSVGTLIGCSRDVVNRICRAGSKEEVNGYKVQFDESDWRKPLKPREYGPSSRRYGKRRGSAYDRWRSQRQRCNDKNYRAYKDYGARGIRVEYSAEEFMDWFENATAHIRIHKLPEYDVGRIDHDKNYRFDNIEIQHVSMNVSERNSRHGNPRESRPVRVFDKETGKETIFKSILDAAREYGMTDASVAHRCSSKKLRFIKKHPNLEFSFWRAD
jgi:hypothetical protein